MVLTIILDLFCPHFTKEQITPWKIYVFWEFFLHMKRQQYESENWPTEKWPNISYKEWACRETGDCWVDEIILDRVQRLRHELGHPLIITSGFRSLEHPIEKKKKLPGAHTYARAIDIQISGERAYYLIQTALEMGFSGVGVKQSGDHSKRYIHLDDMSSEDQYPRPAIWSYWMLWWTILRN